MATIRYGTLDLVPAPELGIAINSRFFGADIRFATSKIYSLKGTILNLQQSGFSGIFIQQTQIETGFYPNYLPFYINGVIVGYPQVKSISFDNSTYVQKNVYNIELEFLDSGNPFQITGAEYGFTGVSCLFNNIENLTESLDYQTDFRTYGYTHSIDITYRSGFNIDPLLNAKLIASGLVNNKSAFPFVTIGGPSGVKTYEERIDTFGGNYSVTEKFHGTTGNDVFTHLFSTQLQLDQNGIVTVSQNGQIQGYDPNRYANAKVGYVSVISNAYNNCQDLYSRNSSGFLNNVYLADTRADDINLGQITYSRSFNDETGVSTFRWQYNQSFEKEENFVRANENGTINGLGHISTRFAVASGAWIGTVKPGILQRLLEQYSGIGLTGNIFNVGRSQTFDKFDGSISYAYDFSNRNIYNLGSGIRSLETTITDQYVLAAVAKFSVINAGEIIQSLQTTRPGQRTVALEIIALRDTPKETLFQFCTNSTNMWRPTGTNFIDPYLSKLSFNYAPLVNSLGSNASYDFNGVRSITNLDL